MTPLRHIRTLRCMHTECSASLTAYSFPQATPLQSGSPPDVHTVFSHGGRVLNKGGSLKNLLSISEDVLGGISVYVFYNDATDLNLA